MPWPPEKGSPPPLPWYGVTDLVGLAASTHDFEAHYMDRLIGPLPGVAGRSTRPARR